MGQRIVLKVKEYEKYYSIDIMLFKTVSNPQTHVHSIYAHKVINTNIVFSQTFSCHKFLAITIHVTMNDSPLYQSHPQHNMTTAVPRG